MERSSPCARGMSFERFRAYLQELEGGLKVELQGTKKALAAREAELREATPAAQQLPAARAEAQRLRAEVPAATPTDFSPNAYEPQRSRWLMSEQGTGAVAGSL
jgi:hypothetical protein